MPKLFFPVQEGNLRLKTGQDHCTAVLLDIQISMINQSNTLRDTGGLKLEKWAERSVTKKSVENNATFRINHLGEQYS